MYQPLLKSVVYLDFDNSKLLQRRCTAVNVNSTICYLNHRNFFQKLVGQEIGEGMDSDSLIEVAESYNSTSQLALWSPRPMTSEPRHAFQSDRRNKAGALIATETCSGSNKLRQAKWVRVGVLIIRGVYAVFSPTGYSALLGMLSPDHSSGSVYVFPVTLAVARLTGILARDTYIKLVDGAVHADGVAEGRGKDDEVFYPTAPMPPS
ncbi:hypothetical protein B0H11DRAFT_2191931 [Mycena galericulata]|nr:hypothetical protein B0H11DRAFT_2191931 [Mycena galericulata]